MDSYLIPPRLPYDIGYSYVIMSCVISPIFGYKSDRYDVRSVQPGLSPSWRCWREPAIVAVRIVLVRITYTAYLTCIRTICHIPLLDRMRKDRYYLDFQIMKANGKKERTSPNSRRKEPGRTRRLTSPLSTRNRMRTRLKFSPPTAPGRNGTPIIGEPRDDSKEYEDHPEVEIIMGRDEGGKQKIFLEEK